MQYEQRSGLVFGAHGCHPGRIRRAAIVDAQNSTVDPDMTPLGLAAARITRLKNGKIYAAHCLLNYDNPVSIEQAIELVHAGSVAFVRRPDAHKVLDALGVPA